MVEAMALGPRTWQAVTDYLETPEFAEPSRPPATKEEQRAYLKEKNRAEMQARARGR